MLPTSVPPTVRLGSHWPDYTRERLEEPATAEIPNVEVRLFDYAVSKPQDRFPLLRPMSRRKPPSICDSYICHSYSLIAQFSSIPSASLSEIYTSTINDSYMHTNVDHSYPMTLSFLKYEQIHSFIVSWSKSTLQTFRQLYIR